MEISNQPSYLNEFNGLKDSNLQKQNRWNK